MSVIKELFEDVADFMEYRRKHKTILVKMSRSSHYKLQLICDDLNEHVEDDFKVTPELLAARVLDVFVNQAFDDNVKKLAKQLLPDLLE
ncbi:hypothetical protein ACFYKX_10260 [Cytobacillus sp. FJAT-54145]|uniref:Uncharacterized protein n=1 Tax=Cytobacillus spartinae TaxID=3299023 RepID=A0ABW6KCM1_9BACI